MPGAPSNVRMRCQWSVRSVVNRVGFETGKHPWQPSRWSRMEFWGGSFLCDPFGRVIAEASHDKKNPARRRDLKALEDTRRNWPFLRDRRIDSYAQITNRLID